VIDLVCGFGKFGLKIEFVVCPLFGIEMLETEFKVQRVLGILESCARPRSNLEPLSDNVPSQFFVGACITLMRPFVERMGCGFWPEPHVHVSACA
jgi:hypothetical protein